MIPPTPGRPVWFYTSKEGLEYQPRAAVIAFAHSDNLVNLATFTENGDSVPYTNILLIQEGEQPPEKGCFATWMPYQVGQAKRDELSNKASFDVLIKRLEQLEGEVRNLKLSPAEGKPFTPADTVTETPLTSTPVKTPPTITPAVVTSDTTTKK